ncbi:hypothetical protein [Lactococcus garvieae]|uniref:hypothetical protein n=1 Tax=Lactococcus garvieae TaxID=1363 RepID=UPI0018D7346B|nr:hypothetical protein [Lactococcus garvieae]QPS70481.1 hypothetical protein I6G50_06885 [Lactococcus garvieae]
MKKLLLITDIVLILTAVLLIFAVRQTPRPAAAPTIEKTITHTKTIDIEQIKLGNFETIHGDWVNSKSDIDNRKASILENTVTKQKRDFYLQYGGVNDQTGQVYLWMYLEGIAPENGSRFEIYPKGSVIPVKLENGDIDYSGTHDPTSKEKDRILPEGSVRTAEELHSLVLYRDTEIML